jgi:hypothetical protein
MAKIRSSLPLLALPVVAVSIGCTALLGDFKASDTGLSEGGAGDTGASSSGSSGASSGGSGGGPMDGPTSGSEGGDATTKADGGEAGAPLKILACDSWDLATPTLVMKLFPSDGGGGNNLPFNGFVIHHLPGTSTARMLIATSTPSSGVSIATLPEQSGATPSIISVTGMAVQATQKTDVDLQFIGQTFGPTSFGYYAIEDSAQGTASSDVVGPAATIGNVPTTGSSSTNSLQMQFLTLSPSGTNYALASYQNNGTYQAAAWLPGAASWNVVVPAGASFSVGSSALLQDGTNVYDFVPPPGSGGGAPGPLDQYTFPTDSTLGPASRSVLASASETAVTAAADVASDGSYELAFITPSAQAASLRLGKVSQANIGSFTIDDLAALQFDVQDDAGIFDTTPFSSHGNGGGGMRWLSNGDFGALGSGGTGGGNYTGLNFYVATPDGQWLVETAGTGQNILAGQTIYGSAFDLEQSVTSLLLKFDFAYVLQESDGGYALYFNVLNCGS